MAESPQTARAMYICTEPTPSSPTGTCGYHCQGLDALWRHKEEAHPDRKRTFKT